MQTTELTSTPKISRRSALRRSALALGALPFFSAHAEPRSKRMGLTVASYGARRQLREPVGDLKPFRNALDVLEHCHQLGAGGVQVSVRGWQDAFAKQVRDRREELGLYLEGQISLPKNTADVARFDTEIAATKEAGATIVRTVALGGRRYETFDSEQAFRDFKLRSWDRLRLAEPVVRKHRVHLAVENHKDWRVPELIDIMVRLSSEWVGVCLDTGNSISLLENAMEVVEALAPFTTTIHFKDMGVQETQDGFLLSEVPFGQGMLDLQRIIDLCHAANPAVQFNLEMITRDPLPVPCLTEAYWKTFPSLSGAHLARTLGHVREHESSRPLPRTAGMTLPERVRYEEDNIVACFNYTRTRLQL